MTKDEALKLALDAFGEIAWSNETQWQRDRAKEAITAIKEALAQPEQEPDKYVMDIECTQCGAKQSGILTVNTTPPQRKPLTDEEIRLQWSEFWETECHPWAIEFARAIEAAHGIKENT